MMHWKNIGEPKKKGINLVKEDLIRRRDIIHSLNTIDRYVSEKLVLCDTDETFPQNEVFIVDDVYEAIEELFDEQNK